MGAEYRCNRCGMMNPAHAQFCGSCGAPLAPPSPPGFNQGQMGQQQAGPSIGQPSGQTATSSKAIVSLILGILGLFLCGPFTAVPGIIVAKMELNAIRQGLAPQANEGLAKAGFWVSVVVTVLSVFFCLGAVLLALLGFLPLFRF